MIIVDKVWVVTGGGSGIGRELVLQLLAQGASVANVDTNAEGLKETARLAGEKKYNLSSHILDITDRESVRTLPKEVIKRHGAVDGIINNARMDQALKPVQELEYEQIEEIMNINFYGMVNMVRAFLPHLLLRTTSYIVNVSNMRGLIPCSGQAVFSASMGAVKLFTEGLSAELKGSPVKVAIIYPGAIHTNIMVNSGLESPIDQKKKIKKEGERRDALNRSKEIKYGRDNSVENHQTTPHQQCGSVQTHGRLRLDAHLRPTSRCLSHRLSTQ